MIGLDAAEPRLIEEWSQAGLLPNLRRVRESSLSGRLNSSADWLAGSPWPTFYTGTDPGEHGLYHAMQWRSEHMRQERPAPAWLELEPFWRTLPRRGRRVVALDMPMTYGPGAFGGVEISGWATHDLLAPPAAEPADLMQWAEETVGPRIISDEVYGPQRVQQLLKLRGELIDATDQLTSLALAMMARFEWDLFAVGFGALHRGGHKLWDLSGIKGDWTEREAGDFENSLRSVYVACDRAVGRLLEQAGGETPLLIFSLHGMGPNTSRVEILPEMLRRVLANAGGEAEAPRASSGLLKTLRSRVPIEWRSAVKRRLPAALQDRLTAFWRMRGLDWRRTKAFAAIADLQGYVRINVAGREAEGIVEAGAPQDDLCGKIEEGLKTFVDADTEKPIIQDLRRSGDLFPGGSRLERLPDLLIRWAQTPAAAHRTVTSRTFGSLNWPSPGKNPDGRSGNHRPEGFFVLKDPAATAHTGRVDAHILDLAPTVLRLLDLEIPASMRGKPLGEPTGSP